MNHDKIIIENMDKYIPDKKQYIKLNALMPDPSKHIAIIGGTGSGKSNLLLNMLKYMYFDRLYLFTKDLTEDKYELLKKMIDAMEQKINTQLNKVKNRKMEPIKVGYYSESLKDLPALNDLPKDQQIICIFDDFLTDKMQKPIEEYYKRSRKYGVTCIYLSQNLFDIPKIIRKNVSYLCIFDNGSAREVQEYAKSYSSRIPYKVFIEIYKNIMSHDHAFMVIDTATRDLRKHIREGFDGIHVLDNYIKQNHLPSKSLSDDEDIDITPQIIPKRRNLSKSINTMDDQF